MRRLKAPPEPPAELAAGLTAIRDELEVPGKFPAEVVQEAEEAAQCEGPGLEPGRELTVRLVEAELRRRVVRFAPAA